CWCSAVPSRRRQSSRCCDDPSLARGALRGSCDGVVNRPVLSRPLDGISAAHGGDGSSSPGPLSPEYCSIHSSRLKTPRQKREAIPLEDVLGGRLRRPLFGAGRFSNAY